jgi:PAS domain S-box-containing protein
MSERPAAFSPPEPADRAAAWPARYGAALLILAAALACKLFLFDGVSRDYPFVFLFAAVAGAAWVGGLGPSLLVVALGAGAASWFWIGPVVGQSMRLILFLAEAVLVAVLSSAVRAAFVRAPTALADRSRQLLDTVRDFAIFRLDGAGRVATWNAGAADILGCPEAKAVGRPFADFVTAEDRAAAQPKAELEEAAKAGRSERTCIRQRADGSQFWAEAVITASPAGDGYAVVLRDISARRLEEESFRELDEKARQAQRLEAVGRLAGGIAHDFNNLLTVILGNLDLILEHNADPNSLRPLLEDVRAAGKRAADLTRRLLLFSRREPSAPRRIDVNALVADTVSMLRRVIAEHITLTTDLDRRLGPVLADHVQVEHVVVNLVVNARDAMPKGGTLTVRTTEVTVAAKDVPADAEGPPGRYVVLSVADTGLGMDDATKARIFDPFFTTKEVGKGTGLGLATVYGNVKQAKGWVTVESRMGSGSTLRVYLPRAEGPVEPEGPTPAPLLVQSGTETVLLVEDEAALRDLAKRALEAAGYTVLACPDGRAAIEASRTFSGPIHLVVTDLVMPRMNGRELAAMLKQDRPRLKVLFMSGYSDSTLAGLSLDGLEELLDKPFVGDDLARKVREMLDRK